MACVPPRAGASNLSGSGSSILSGFESAQGVTLTRCKMKQILVRSSLWHKMCRGWLPVMNVRKVASQAVVVEEMEASEPSEAIGKKTVHRQRWQAHETMALIAAKRQQDLWGMESTEASGIESKKMKNMWKEVEAFCREKGIERSAQQCQTRWSRLMSAFTQIKSWEETRKPEQPSFWSLKLDERKTMGFQLNLDQRTYNALDEFFNSKADAKGNVLVKEHVAEAAELRSINRMSHGYDGKKSNSNEADVNFSHIQGESHEIENMTNLHTSSYKSDEMLQTECLNISKPIGKENNEMYIRDADDDVYLENSGEHRHENHVDQRKALENTKILSEYLQLVIDDRNKAKLPHVRNGKVDLKSTVLHTGQQVESLNVSEIADHSDPLILCNREAVNVEAQLLPASTEMIDGSKKDSSEMPLVVVDDCNKAQLLRASAENVDCNPTNLNAGQRTESLKYFEKGEHIILKSGCDQRDASGKAALFPSSAETIDGSNTDLWNGSVEECEAVEKTIAMHGNDEYVPSSCVMYGEIVQAAQDEGIEKGVDGSVFKTNAPVIDSLVVEGTANANSVPASVEESWECQKESHLSSTGVDARNANQSTQIVALSCISVDKEDRQNDSADRILAEEAWSDKNEKGGGCEINSLRCPENAEDISTAWEDNFQGNFVEAQMKNDACQMSERVVAQSNILTPGMEAAFVRSKSDLLTRFEQEEDKLNPLQDVEEEIGTGVLKQGLGDNHTVLRGLHIESTHSHQAEDFLKIDFHPSEEGHTEMIAYMTQRNATMPECNTGHSFEEKKADLDIFDKREPCDQMQSDHEKDGNDTIERMKAAIKEGDCLTGKTEIRASAVDTNPPALTCIHNQFQHTSEQKSTVKGDAGSFENVSEAKRVEVAENKPKEVEFIIKDDRGASMIDGRGSKEDWNQRTSTGRPADEDVFMDIPAATGTLVKSALQTIRKFFKF